MNCSGNDGTARTVISTTMLNAVERLSFRGGERDACNALASCRLDPTIWVARDVSIAGGGVARQNSSCVSGALDPLVRLWQRSQASGSSGDDLYNIGTSYHTLHDSSQPLDD